MSFFKFFLILFFPTIHYGSEKLPLLSNEKTIKPIETLNSQERDEGRVKITEMRLDLKKTLGTLHKNTIISILRWLDNRKEASQFTKMIAFSKISSQSLQHESQLKGEWAKAWRAILKKDWIKEEFLKLSFCSCPYNENENMISHEEEVKYLRKLHYDGEWIVKKNTLSNKDEKNLFLRGFQKVHNFFLTSLKENLSSYPDILPYAQTVFGRII